MFNGLLNGFFFLLIKTCGIYKAYRNIKLYRLTDMGLSTMSSFFNHKIYFSNHSIATIHSYVYIVHIILKASVPNTNILDPIQIKLLLFYVEGLLSD